MKFLETSPRTHIKSKIFTFLVITSLSLSSISTPMKVNALENDTQNTVSNYSEDDFNGTVYIDYDVNNMQGFRDYINMELFDTENNPEGTKVYLVTTEKQYNENGDLIEVKKELDITGKSKFILPDIPYGYQSEAYLKFVNEDLNLEKEGEKFTIVKPADYYEDGTLFTVFYLILEREQKKIIS